MVSSDLPLFMVVSFLLLTFLVGIYCSNNVKDIKEYAIGNKEFSTATLIATIVATAYGGGGLTRNVEQVHAQGLYWIVWSSLGIFSIWIISPLASRMQPFMENLSMADTIGRVYGRIPRVITVLSSVAASIASLAIQINVITLAISVCTDLNNTKAISMIATLILVFYSAFGGIRAVAYTDTVQFVTFFMVIPILACILFQKTGKSTSDVIHFLGTQKKFEFESISGQALISLIALRLAGLFSYIEPPMIQRVYMAKTAIQAKKSFFHAGILSFVIKVFILLVGVAVLIAAPELSTQGIWGYIMGALSPVVKGLVCMVLLSMAMSTADSILNACAVMISYDLIKGVFGEKIAASINQLEIARLTSATLGIFAMILTFYKKDLLDLLKLSFDLTIPVIVAPFILAVFGFRGTSIIATVGMVIGGLSIYLWNKWIKPKTGIDGSFVCMLANGVAMLATYYLFPQPEGVGWIKEKKSPRKKRIDGYRKYIRKQQQKASFRQELERLKPSDTTLLQMAFYIAATTMLSLSMMGMGLHSIVWHIARLVIAVVFYNYGMQKSRGATHHMPLWGWFMGIIWILPVDVIFHWWYNVSPVTTILLSFTHLVYASNILPLYFSKRTILLTLSAIAYRIYMVGVTDFLQADTRSLYLLLILLMSITFFSNLENKNLINQLIRKICNLKTQQEQEEKQKVKETVYTADHITKTTKKSSMAEAADILGHVEDKLNQAVERLGDTEKLTKRDFKAFINKYTDWRRHYDKTSTTMGTMVLDLQQVYISRIINEVEMAIKEELGTMPRITIHYESSQNIECEMDRMVKLFTYAVLSVINKKTIDIDTIHCDIRCADIYNHEDDKVHRGNIIWQTFEALSIVISNNNTPPEKRIPHKKRYITAYRDFYAGNINEVLGRPLDPTTHDMLQIVRAHYGYMQLPKEGEEGFLIVLPQWIHLVQDSMQTRWPLDSLITDHPVDTQGSADALTFLMDFNENICKTTDVDPIIIKEIVSFIKEKYGDMRHDCGELLYVRAVGIAKLVARWTPHSPKVIYTALLYDLVRHLRTSLSHIEEKFGLGIASLIEDVISVDKYRDLDEAIAKTKVYVIQVDNETGNEVEKEQPNIVVLYIKLAERLYDMQHGAGYTNKKDLFVSSSQGFYIDSELAAQYLDYDPEIEKELEAAAEKGITYYQKETDIVFYLIKGRRADHPEWYFTYLDESDQ
ncbi:sodium:solute symporter family transporter [Cardinium endosymbiont of Culicoides punctatus]|uniref:sodium:solute symporter family transporter n=1 Tax=Cardinium endosymbiont of Culicoides punctatus TaxID=2304601 RepID=UPI00105890D9|nr:HD domain-containing protein [Cardinium endosymbiont of Culicoides punctatus]TDG95050.1 hypothetical protein CCPUN_06360 [Cardinium endosymbiont of Culicoides punctatus]